MNILLIDDDDLFLYLTEKTLKKAECLENIYSISNVEDARAYLDSCVSSQTAFPDVIFVDMNMPEMKGTEFADYYKNEYAAHSPNTKLVILTSSISRKEKIKSMEMAVVNDFMQKPLTIDKLNSLL